MSESPQQLSEKVLSRMLENDKFSEWLGIEVDSISPGNCELHFTVRPEMVNGFGIVHGGIVFSAADSAFAFACNSHGRLTVALEVSISFTRPSKPGDKLRVVATEKYLGNKTSLYDISVYNEAKELVASFKGTAYRTSRSVLEA